MSFGGEDDPRYGRDPPRPYFGKYAGFVTDNSAPAQGAHRGQVVVQVPGILEETADGSSQQPIAVLAAPAFLPGFFFVPEVSDTVWVEFVGGDINYPIWTGVWYPQDTSPKTAGGDPPTQDQKIIRTKSSHVVQLDDTGGSEQLIITDQTNGNTITLDAGGISLNSLNGITLTFAPNSGTSATLTLDTGGITATCGQSSVAITSEQITLGRPAVTLAVASTVDVS